MLLILKIQTYISDRNKMLYMQKLLHICKKYNAAAKLKITLPPHFLRPVKKSAFFNFCDIIRGVFEPRR